ncbi:hypothetical protein [Streptomyces sp. NPDC002467]|uniref:hypothetical protein n=1 Tax=Streptomyces sp. NPDC002467 TaxID=3364647 RepID=UPI0036891900
MALSRVLDVPLSVLEDPTLRREFLTDVAGSAIAPVVASDHLARVRRPPDGRAVREGVGGQVRTVTHFPQD